MRMVLALQVTRWPEAEDVHWENIRDTALILQLQNTYKQQSDLRRIEISD